MNEKPIIFSSEMVRAILGGRKIMARRVMKIQPTKEPCWIGTVFDTTGHKKNIGKHFWFYDHNESDKVYFSCPYGKVGDRLWVQECFLAATCSKDTVSVHYKASLDDSLDDQWRHGVIVPDSHKYMPTSKPSEKWYSGRFMPRWASRITLEIINIGVERVQEITADDAFNEGVRVDDAPIVAGIRVHENKPLIEGFKTLWDSINKKRGYGWDVNPYVWVIEFKRVNK